MGNRRRWRALVTGLVLAAAASSAGTTGPAGATPAPDAPADAPADGTAPYIVVLEGDDSTRAEVEAHAEDAGAEPTAVYRHALDGYAADLTPGQVAALRDDDRVAEVVEDTTYELLDQAVPPGVRRTFGPDNPATGIGAATDRRVDADVAIIDSGVNNHDDLAVVERFDCLGTGGCTPGGFDDSGHGTHVAGTVGAINNGLGVVGTAPGARIWSFKVCGGASISCPSSAIVAAVDQVTARATTIEAVNMSIGGTNPNTALAQAITRAVDAGVVIVAAAGNDNVDAATFQPANHPDVITVSALVDTDGRAGGTGGAGCLPHGPDDTLATFSNWGATVEVAAPGSCILSTQSDGRGYETRSGTSMAAPHVTGAAASLASADKPTNRAEALALRSDLVAAGNRNWSYTSRGPGDTQEPLLDLHDPARFAPRLVAPTYWDRAAAVPGGVAQFADAQCAQDPDGYYTFGGTTTGVAATDTAWRFDHRTGRWSELARYPGGPREGLAATCTPEGRIHVVGGTGDDHFVYDIATNRWSTAARLPRDTVHAAVGAWGTKVFVAGGLTSPFAGVTDRVDVYDSATGAWTTAPAPMPVAVGRAGVARAGRFLYVVGGWGASSPTTNVDRTLRLDMSTGTWSAGPAFTGARADAGLVATDDALYALGGFAPGTPLDPTGTVERLPLASWPTGAWTALPGLPTPVGMAGAACSSTGRDGMIASVGGAALNELTPAWRDEHWRRVAVRESCASDNWGTWAAAPGPAATAPSARLGVARCATGPTADGFLTFGGVGQNPAFPLEASAATGRYDAGTRTWTARAPHPSGPRSAPAAVCRPDGRAHVVGGGTGADHHLYDPVAGTWTALADLPRDTNAAAIGHWQGKVYVVGGQNGLLQPSARVDVYDVATNAWSTGTALPEPIGAAGYAQSGRYLYVVGGQGTGSPAANVTRTLRLDLQTGTWASGPVLPSGRADLGLVATDRALYALGGHASAAGFHTPTEQVQRLDLAAWPAGSWTAFEALPTAVGFVSAACVPTAAGAGVTAVGGLAMGYAPVRPHWQAVRPGETCPVPG